MATVTWDEMIPSLAPFLPNAPRVSMRGALLASASNFLAKTYLWRAAFDPFETEPGVSDYGLFSDALIESVLWLKVGNQAIPQTDSRFVDKSRIDKQAKPTAFWVVNGRTVRFFPIPDGVHEITGEVVLKPSTKARGLEEWIVDAWQDAIVSGAIYRLAQIPGKDWSSADLAQYHKMLHDREIANARAHQLQNVPLRVRMHKV